MAIQIEAKRFTNLIYKCGFEFKTISEFSKFYLLFTSSSRFDSFPSDFRRRPEVNGKVNPEVDLWRGRQELEPFAEDAVLGGSQHFAFPKVLDEAMPGAVQTSLHDLKHFRNWIFFVL